MKRVLLALLLLAGGVRGEDLLEIYRLALQNDPDFRAARAALKAGLEARNLGLAQLLPRVGLDASYGQSLVQGRGQFPAGGLLVPNKTDRAVETKQWGVSLRQPLFDLTAWFRFREGEALSEEAKARFAAASQDLILRVAEAYFSVLKARVDLEALRAQEEATRRQLDQARARFEVGLAAITDLREAEAAFDLTRAQRIAAEGALEVARERLFVLTGRRPEALEVLAADYPVLPPEPSEPSAWVQFARAHNYDLKAADLAVEAAHARARAAAAGHLPRLTLQLGYRQSRGEVDFHNKAQAGARYTEFASNVDQGSFSLNLELPLFSGGEISARRRQAFAEYERAREEQLGVARRTVQETRAAFVDVMTALARVEAGRKAVASGKTSLEATEAGYEVGTRTVVDVLLAIQNYYRAVRDYEQARIDYLLATFRLKRLAGILSPADLEAVNRFLEPAASKN